MNSELLKKESPKSNLLISGNHLIRTSGNINFDADDVFHAPDGNHSAQIIDEAICAFINGYKKYGQSNGSHSQP